MKVVLLLQNKPRSGRMKPENMTGHKRQLAEFGSIATRHHINRNPSAKKMRSLSVISYQSYLL